MRRTTLMVIASGLAAPALAQGQAITGFTGGSLFNTFQANGDTVGWYFNTSATTYVTHLGFWDTVAAPMVASHDVGLWTSGGTLLASTSVAPASPLTGDFRYAPLPAPVLLTPGTYVVGAYYPAANPGSDGYMSNCTSITTNPQITHLGSTRDPDGVVPSLAFPSVQTAGGLGRIGPNFLFVNAALTGLTGGSVFATFEADGDTAGWHFKANAPMRVTHLGFWDSITAPNVAMTGSHEVGLWNSAGVLLSSVTVTPASPLTGDFRYEPLAAPILLVPGATYVMGAYYPALNPTSDGYVTTAASLSTVPQATHLGANRDPSGPAAALAFPSVLTPGARGRIGPNLLFQSTDALIAVDSSRALYEVNKSTGALTSIGTTDAAPGITGGLTRDPLTDTIYASSTSFDALYTLDLSTGAMTLVGPYGDPNIVMHGLEYDPTTGRLFGASSHNGGIYDISRTTGAATLIGIGLAGSTFTNLGHDPVANVLYATSSATDSFYSVNRATGVMTLIGALAGPSNPNGLAFDTSGSRLYLQDNTLDSLYTINTATGAATLVGANGPGNLIGLVYLPRTIACYANCDSSTQAPVLNVGDFTCFLQKYAASDPYANCDASTQAPVLNVGDFTCFLQKYASGCP